MVVWQFADIENEVIEKDLTYLERFIHGKTEPISIITGIETGYLPVDQVLTPKQKSLLARDLEALLNHYNFYSDFPANYPDEKNTSSSLPCGMKNMFMFLPAECILSFAVSILKPTLLLDIVLPAKRWKGKSAKVLKWMIQAFRLKTFFRSDTILILVDAITADVKQN